jgi:hypothetical protein
MDYRPARAIEAIVTPVMLGRRKHRRVCLIRESRGPAPRTDARDYTQHIPNCARPDRIRA